MIVAPINTNAQVSFGYHSPLKTLFLKGKLPTVKKGFYGDTLTKNTVSLEHLEPHCFGGKTDLTNLVLASKKNNQARGNDDIANYLDEKNVTEYLQQFIGIKLPNFDGDKYIQGIIKKLGELLCLKK